MNDKKISEIANAILNYKNVVFFGGAGVSTASGIPDFRSGRGLFDSNFKGISPETIVSHDFLLNETKLFYEFYFKYLVYPKAKPNFTHEFIAWLEKYKNIAVVTQNIDDLHQLAGSTKVIQIHGTTSSYHCMGCFKKYNIEQVIKFKPNIPICSCSQVIRPDVTLYQEQLDEKSVNNAINAISKADILIVCGSSLVVYPASFYINYFKGKKLIIINKQETSYDKYSDIVIHDDMNKIFKEVKNILESKLNEKNKLLYATNHLDLYETEKGFVYAQRRTINSIACLVFKNIDNKTYFLIRYQPMPEIEEKNNWSDLYPCPITGSIEKNETPIESAIREVYEEGGIVIDRNNVVASSISISSTQMNEKVHNFLIESKKCIENKPNGDGTIFESVSVNKWVDEKELLQIIFENKNIIHLSSLESCYLLFLKYKNIL